MPGINFQRKPRPTGRSRAQYPNGNNIVPPVVVLVTSLEKQAKMQVAIRDSRS